jgi:hypothetical protein
MSSVVAQDFLLATTVLVLDLDEDLVSPVLPPLDSARSGLPLDRAPPAREEIVTALQSACRIWTKASKRSHEARKAATAVELVLAKINPDRDPTPDTSHCEFTHLSV